MLMKQFSGIKNHDHWQKADGINWMEGHLSFLKHKLEESGKLTYNSSGSPDQWMTHAKSLKPGQKVKGSMMRRVINLQDIKAGCILINELHLMIAMGTVQPGTGNLRVADSTSIPHGPKDKRHKTHGGSGSGMGKGYIVVKNGSNGFEMKRSIEPNWSNANTLKMWVLKPVV